MTAELELFLRFDARQRAFIASEERRFLNGLGTVRPRGFVNSVDVRFQPMTAAVEDVLARFSDAIVVRAPLAETSLFDFRRPMGINPRQFGVEPTCRCTPPQFSWRRWRNEAGSYTCVCATCTAPWLRPTPTTPPHPYVASPSLRLCAECGRPARDGLHATRQCQSCGARCHDTFCSPACFERYRADIINPSF